jgi:hypothetical protein
MKKYFPVVISIYAISCLAVTCKKQPSAMPPAIDTSLVNLNHLDYLYVPLTLSGVTAAGVYIYSQAPDYLRVGDADEGFTCVDDVARAIQVYARSLNFSSDTAIQEKCIRLIRFVLTMQSSNGYFYNFLLPDNTINTFGATSVNSANWWSWRALYALSEAEPLVKLKDAQLADQIDNAISKLVTTMKSELVPAAKTTKTVSGFDIPTWLPVESGTDQAAIIVMGLIIYCTTHSDTALTGYIRKLSDGILLMQQGDSTHFPYSCILSWENTWHAYAGDQALALMKAGAFLKDDTYTKGGLAEVNNFFPWLLQNGMKSSLVLEKTNGEVRLTSEATYAQIAYGVRPVITAAIEAYKVTKQEKYADMAGHFAAWFFGANNAMKNIYSTSTGLCFDGIESSTSVNRNSGAESTIEALLAMEAVESQPLVKSALNKYKK